MLIRPVQQADAAGLWRILEPMIRAGESYPLPRDMREPDALGYWLQPTHAVFVAEAEGTLLGKRNPSTVKITALDPPKSVEIEATDSRGISGHVFTFTPQDGGTLVTRQIYGVKQPLLGPVFFMIFKSKIDVNFNGALSNLKTKMESSST